VLYDYRVEYDEFQDAVLGLADGGTRLTKGSVALRLKVEPASAGAMLDRMTRDGRLELDLDEGSGEIFYEVRRKGGVRDKPQSSALAGLGKALDSGALAAKVGVGAALAMAEARGGKGALVPADKRRNLAVGVLVGGLFPGIGLVYTAPWPVALGASAVVIVGYKILALIPFFSSFLLIPFLAVCAVASAVLGGLYTWQYNQNGKRTPLGDDRISPKRLLGRIRKL
jgi:hypothetical protein